MDIPLNHPPRKLGQACDRCRKKKIKCDGELPECRNCTRGGKPCEASAPLQRNTRVRGFVTDDKHVQGLQSQLLECQRALQSERETNSLLRQQLAEQQNKLASADSLSVAPTIYHGERSAFLNPPSVLGGPKLMSDDSSHVIKHMGRLVHDVTGVSRFAGSTTGVHFILSVEDSCKQALYLTESFPDSCYSLYLAGSAIGANKATSSATPDGYHQIWNLSSPEILELLGHPFDFYVAQIDEFLGCWEAFCPVLARKETVDAVCKMLEGIQDRAMADGVDNSTLCVLFSIMSINNLGRPISHPVRDQIGRLVSSNSIFDSLQSRLVARGDLYSLQGLVLLSFYYQLTGQSLGLIKVNGSMVRIAQSLGLHRHARRFRMNVGEIELRKRLWWWVYIFDRVTAIVHGLPPLISDDDVDNELPTDCHIDDFTATEIYHPLPGQTTPVSFFNHYATLSKKMSSILDLLYTTTRRRQGVAKIERLDRDIRVWSQNLGLDDAPEPDSHSHPTTSGCGALLFYLRLLSRFCILLIHRPGLTFDDSTSEFADCLGACVRASTDLIHLLGLPDLGHSFLSCRPIGPGVVFQCALMHIFYHCKSKTLNLLSFSTLQESTDLILHVITVLEKCRPDPRTAPSGDSSHNDRQTRSIDSAIAVLRNLTLLLQHDSSGFTSWPTGPLRPNIPYGLPSSSLYDLNYMTAMDWAQDISDTFGHLPDLGG